MRKVFLGDLPRWGKGEGSGNIGTINWGKCIGYKVEFVYDDIKGEVEIIDYVKNGQTLTVRYKHDDEFEIKSSSFSNCGLGGLLKKHTKEFKVEVGTHFKDDKRDIVIIDRDYREKENKADDKGRIYNKNLKFYKFKCNKCGWDEGWIEESKLILRGNGCGCCSNKVAVLGINTIWDTDRWMCDLGVSEEDARKYTKCSQKRIKVKCSDCQKCKTLIVASIFYVKSICCSCGDRLSYPEKFMYSVLRQLNIEFENQYSPSYLKKKDVDKYNKKYSDFYLPDHKLVIETDGEIGHEGGKIHEKSNKTLEELIEIDNWKDEQHLKHGVKTIRINCFKSDMEYIKNNILNSELSNIFNLSKIDWLECEKFALGNLVKEVCNYWNKKEEWETTKTISKNNPWGIKTSDTISRYLKKGKGLGWTDYSSEDEFIRGRKIANEKVSKPITILKEGVIIGTFKSASELARQSENLFGIKLSSSGITRVCTGIYRYYKGFQFKYN